MKLLQILQITAVSLLGLRLQAAAAANKEDSTVITGDSESVDCLASFNEARVAAGLSPFTDGTDAFKETLKDQTFANTICTAILTQQKVVDYTKVTKTLALAIQDGTTADCPAAVAHFNAALPLFGALPPAFSISLEVYRKLQAISFVALYNPQENAKLACSYFTCKSETTPAAPTRSSTEEGDEKETATAHALLCATAPQALQNGILPFTQEQFDNIKKAINSAPSTAPTIAVLAAAAVALVTF